MEQKFINIGDKTYKCKIAKSEEDKRQGLMYVESLPPDEGMKKFYVYLHKNKINGKVYVGITCRKNPNYRWQNGEGYKDQVFYRAIKKYGWENFEHIIYSSNISEQEAKQTEIALIKQYKSGGNCYNITDGGDGRLGIPMHENTRSALKKANTGRTCSEETRKKISNSEKGKHCSEKNKQLYKELYTGKKLSEEHKEKIKTNNRQSKTTILLEIATGKTFEFNSARQASLWLGLNESAVGHAIKDNYLLQNGKFKAYRKNETSQS